MAVSIGRIGSELMRRLLLPLGCVLALAAPASPARADIIVTLEAFDGDDPVEGSVAPDTELSVDILLSVTADDDPLNELRVMQFDFRDTGNGLDMTDFEWLLDELGVAGSYFVEPSTSIARADYIFGDIIDLGTEPLRVARVTLVAKDDGTLDLTGAETADPNNNEEGLFFSAGIAAPRDFSIFEENVQGGTLLIEVRSGGGHPGQNDNQNENENENQNGNQNDNEGSNDNDGQVPNGPDSNANEPESDRDVGPLAEVQFCGFGMLGTLLAGLGSLTIMRLHRRIWR